MILRSHRVRMLRFLSLWVHSLKVVLSTVSGDSQITTATGTIDDTVAPDIRAVFVDDKNGANIASINNREKAEISTNVCDI